MGSSRSRIPLVCGLKLLLVDKGFTLVELLIGLVIAGVVASAAGLLLLYQMKSASTLELAQRQRDNAGRFDYLIQIEAAEAASVVENASMPAACSGGGTAVAAFRIPRDKGQYLDVNNSSLIYYYNKGSDLWRCGPPVKRSGVLDHDASRPLQAGIVVRDALLEKAVCNDEATNKSQLVYQLKYQKGYRPGCSIASAKTLLICNQGDICD